MKLAIVKLSALGDIVHAMVGLQFIKAQLPDVTIDWIVEQRFAPVLEHNPDLNAILPVNLKALKTNPGDFFKQLTTITHYRHNHYDWVIDAQGLLKSALTARLLGANVAGFDADSIRERAASWFYQFKVNCPYERNTIDRNAQVLFEPLHFAISAEQICAKQAFLFYRDADPAIAEYLRNDLKNIVFVIGSTWPSRQYPLAHWLEVAEALQQNCLVVWGGEAERQAAAWLAERSEWIRVMPKLDLNSLKALLAKADLTIGNDTGPTHMAWGLNKASITLFGPTPVSRVYQTQINKVLKSPSVVNPYRLNRQDFSINEISSNAVVDIAASLLF